MSVRLGVVATAVLGAAVAAATERVHVVQRGESLWQIAEAACGDPGRWEELYRANRDQIKDPQVLHPGQRLTIPETMEGPVPAGSREPVRER